MRPALEKTARKKIWLGFFVEDKKLDVRKKAHDQRGDKNNIPQTRNPNKKMLLSIA